MLKKYIDPETRHMAIELKNVILLLLTVIDLVFIFLSITYSFNFKVENLFADYDFLVCLLLFIDLSYDFYIYDGSLKQFLIDDKNIIAFISIFPFDILFRYFSVFRLFRLVKLIKIVRIYNVVKDLDSLVYFIKNHFFKLLFVIFTIYVAISTVLLIVLDDSFDTIGEAFWFIAVTASTVGYGDYIPVSPIGKSLTVLTIIMGIIFVAIVTAYLASVYNERYEMETRGTILKHVDKVEKGTKINYNELKILNDRIEVLEKENRELSDKMDSLDEKLDEIIGKLEK